MTDWRTHLTPDEAEHLSEIERKRNLLTSERQAMHNRAKQRKHRKDQGGAI